MASGINIIWLVGWVLISVFLAQVNTSIQMQPVSLPRSIQDGSTLSTPSAPYVMPTYYGAIIVAEAIGHTGTAIITEIQTGDANRISAYAFYEKGTLKRAVFLNSLTYNISDPASQPRQKTHVSLNINGTSSGSSLVQLKRLYIRYVLPAYFRYSNAHLKLLQ